MKKIIILVLLFISCTSEEIIKDCQCNVEGVYRDVEYSILTEINDCDEDGTEYTIPLENHPEINFTGILKCK